MSADDLDDEAWHYGNRHGIAVGLALHKLARTTLWCSALVFAAWCFKEWAIHYARCA